MKFNDDDDDVIYSYARCAYGRSYRCASFGVCHPHDLLVLLILLYSTIIQAMSFHEL